MIENATAIRKESENRIKVLKEEAEAVRKDYTKKSDSVKTLEEIYKKKLSEVSVKEKQLNKCISEESDRKVASVRGDLIIQYRAKYVAHNAFYVAVLLYGVLMTIFKGITADAIQMDVVNAVKWLNHILLKGWSFALSSADAVSVISDEIPQEMVASVVHWIVYTLVVAIITALPIVVFGYGVYKLADYYYYELWDKISLAVVLVTLAVVVNFSKEIKSFSSVNLVVVLLAVQAVYVGIRVMVKNKM